MHLILREAREMLSCDSGPSISAGLLRTGVASQAAIALENARLYQEIKGLFEGFAGVSDIAYAHHEKINGGGCPRGIAGDEIPPQGKILMIADIFDALRAPDRPYKKSVGIERAIRILEMEKDEGAIAADLLEILVQGKVWEILPK